MLLALWLAAALLTACSRDPKESALQSGMMLMESIVTSRVLNDVVHAADPQMRATTAVDAALRGAVTASFRQPPEEITIVNESDKPSVPWSVVLIGDDARKQVRIEGYGTDLQKPLSVRVIEFPRK